MTTSTTELGRFHDYISGLLARGNVSLLPEDALDSWRLDHPLDDFDETDDGLDDVQAVKEALADLDAGDPGRPVDEVLDEISREFGLVNPRIKN